MDEFITKALRPLVRLCLRQGIKAQTFFEITKQVFISVAIEELRDHKAAESVSKISAMTGLQRKDIKRLQADTIPPLSTPDILMRIVGHWCGNKSFTDSKGKPKVLSLSGETNEFARLVASVSQDLSPYTALFELERLGVAKKNETTVTLVRPSIEISQDQEIGLKLLADDIEHLTTGVAANVFQRPPVPNLHARTQYDNIAPGALAEIQRWILERGTAFHTELRTFLSRFDRDLNPTLDSSPDRVVITVGTFSATEQRQKR